MIEIQEELKILREMNRELMEENEHLRCQIRALEELAIDTNLRYNEGVSKTKGVYGE
tara:strand:- start:44 stop:214 length:171 start_codon:yes stop_codon:yes gene_type:complete